jgi:hypothetical protein
MLLIAFCQVSAQRRPALIKLLLIMKLTAILCIIACLHVSAGGYAQKITIYQQNASLKSIFTEIKRQTEYTFVYTDDFLQQSKTVTIDVKNAPLEAVLDICFKDQPFTYTVFNKMVVLKARPAIIKDPPGLPASPVDIKGKVSNEKGEPLNDVSVQKQMPPACLKLP